MSREASRRASAVANRATVDDRWRSFIAFWLVAGLALFGLGVSVFAASPNGHRVGGVLVLAGVVCLAIGLGVRRAGRRASRTTVV
jgi:hypothetical protein